MANEKIDTTQNIITSPEGDREKEKRLLEALKAIPDEEIIRLWEERDEEEKRKNIWTIAWMSVEYNESTRTVKFWWEIFDLNPFEWKMSQYADLFNDENVRKVMFTLNI